MHKIIIAKSCMAHEQVGFENYIHPFVLYIEIYIDIEGGHRVSKNTTMQRRMQVPILYL